MRRHPVLLTGLGLLAVSFLLASSRGAYAIGPGQLVGIVWNALLSMFGGPLSYIGFGGKQVRDVLHIDDLCDLVDVQIAAFENLHGKVFVAGGGREVSFSLLELTEVCERVTGRKIKITPVAETRTADIPIYLSDCTKLTAATGWKPTRDLQTLVRDTWEWMRANESDLAPLLGT